ncbi:class I SAM-dependent methyltransferase [Nostoc sp. UIC 10630]|uniref:class I SAM-dependent DNA methyltransferase n=1 Tax=Nostoc sp. UIC 10630 TaxID=2100146 RepID=UPI0013D2B315|nr:class I SAM-dependent methyltransferase [Nostoc sp. UIC 10630]NEU84348.1 methyltransferase domain-containing protein [Nostoc sp. UIC 10630]
MSVQAAYDNWSTTYDADENLTRDLDQIITKETFMSKRYKSVVEIGCGTGKNTLLLSQIAQTVYAVDFSASMIEKAKEKVNSVNVLLASIIVSEIEIIKTFALLEDPRRRAGQRHNLPLSINTDIFSS